MPTHPDPVLVHASLQRRNLLLDLVERVQHKDGVLDAIGPGIRIHRGIVKCAEECCVSTRSFLLLKRICVRWLKTDISVLSPVFGKAAVSFARSSRSMREENDWKCALSLRINHSQRKVLVTGCIMQCKLCVLYVGRGSGRISLPHGQA